MKLDKHTPKSPEDHSYMLKVTPPEALQLIQSLSNQLVAKNCNTGRAEYTTESGEYFSIAVVEEG